MNASSTVNAIRETLTVVILTAMLLPVLSFTLSFWQLQPLEQPRQYTTALTHRWLRADLAEHFPSEIPPAATAIKFRFNAGYLQGGATLELRVRLPAEAVAELERQYRDSALAIFDGSGNQLHGDPEHDVLPKSHFFTAAQRADAQFTEPYQLSDDFEILLLRAPLPVNLNHPRGAGIAIDRAHGDVIFWASNG